MLKKLAILSLILAAIALFYGLDGSRYLSLSQFQTWVEERPEKAAAIYFVSYILVTGLSLPGAALMTLMGGALFGLWWGLLLVSFASSLGASLAFLVSRSLLRDWVQAKFGSYLSTINRGIEKDGAFYLFSLRLIPVIPFFVINLVFGLTPLKLWRFYWVSQVGMLVGTAVYVNAGVELGAVEELSVQGIMTPSLMLAFVLLACFPLLARWLQSRIERHRLYKPFTKPKQFDANLVVIGAGSAGLVTAYIAAAVKAEVILIEKHRMGGDCLNTGCVPSKALIRSANAAYEIGQAAKLGLKNASAEVDFAAVMERVQTVITQVEPHDSIERYSDLGVNCVQGEATLLSPWQVQVQEGNTKRVISARNIVIASGARPQVPDIPGLAQLDYFTSDTIWSLRQQPKHLLVMGGGPIGCELAQAFSRLGSRVTIVGRAAQVMPREDDDVAAFVRQRFESEGIEILSAHQTTAFRCEGDNKIAVLKDVDGQVRELNFDQLLICTGRQANTGGMGLEALGIEVSQRGTLDVDKYLRTRYPNIYACGDVVGPYQFTHMAAHQAWYASVNALFGSLKKFAVDYRVVPWATFTSPEVARVGLSEKDAQQQGLEFDVTRYDLSDLDRAIADSEAQGFVKVLTVKGKDRILGAVIVGYHASDLITEFVTAIKNKWGLNKLLGTIHIYPSVSEANKYVAGEWKRAHTPEKLLNWVEKFHRWKR